MAIKIDSTHRRTSDYNQPVFGCLLTVLTSSILFAGRRTIGEDGIGFDASRAVSLPVMSFSVLVLDNREDIAIAACSEDSSVAARGKVVGSGGGFASTFLSSFVSKTLEVSEIASTFASWGSRGFCTGNGVGGVVDRIGISKTLTTSLLGGGGIMP